MTIKRSDLAAGRVDLSEVTTGRRLPPTFPGRILKHDFLEPLGLSAYALAKALDVPLNRITAILKGTRSITAETDLRLARCLGTEPGFWLRLQAAHDLEAAQAQLGSRVASEVKILATREAA